MKQPLESIRISDRGRDLLIKIKRSTKIETWNTLCRLAFCLSLRDSSVPPPLPQNTGGGIEISWKVFGGQFAEIYSGLLYLRWRKDKAGGFKGTIEECMRRHLFRGLGSLDASTNVKNSGSLISLFKS